MLPDPYRGVWGGSNCRDSLVQVVFYALSLFDHKLVSSVRVLRVTNTVYCIIHVHYTSIFLPFAFADGSQMQLRWPLRGERAIFGAAGRDAQPLRA